MENEIAALKKRVRFGILPAMATPIDPDEDRVNEAVIHKLVDFLVEAGVKGLFVGGSTGEGILLSQDQRKLLHEKSMEASGGRVPVLVHVGSNNTGESIDLARHAAAIKADGIVAVTPYFYGIHDEAIFTHFSSIAEGAPETPFFGYDIPHMAVNGINPALLNRLQAEIPSFGGIKTSNADAQKVRQLIDAAVDDKIVLVGNERIALGSLALGADGMISGLGTAIPEPFVKMLEAVAASRWSEALNYHKRINQILDLLPAGARIGAIKKLIEQRGIPVGPALAPRPMPTTDWQGWNQMRTLLD